MLALKNGVRYGIDYPEESFIVLEISKKRVCLMLI